jgi:hypothetical protein
MDPVHSCLSAHSRVLDAVQAVRELHAGLAQPDMALVLFFCSSLYDLDALAGEMKACFGDVTVVGCTTAGEFGPEGYLDHSISGVSFSAQHFSAVAGIQKNLKDFDIDGGRRFSHALRECLEARTPDTLPGSGFALMLVDGLAVKEELVARAFQDGIGEFPLVGGSAGDGLDFGKTWVYFDGAFHADSALLVLARTSFPVHPFKTQHFSCLAERLVVTEADAARRIVKEINGLPAAAEYARLAGVTVESLSPHAFAASPVVVVIDGTDYVRSIQSANPDGSLTFYCAIEEGLVFRVACCTDLVANLEQAVVQIHNAVGTPQLVLGFDCILRNLEMRQRGLKDAVGQVFMREHFVGFSTYGEQLWGVHVNQTLTGLAIGGMQEHAHG